jgi:hypothetical protein
MEINLYVLGALILNEVGGEVHSDDIVTLDKSAPRRWALEQLP